VFTPADSATLGSVSEPVTLLVTPQETILTESPGTMYVVALSNVELAAKLTVRGSRSRFRSLTRGWVWSAVGA
jgi:hypothetical protein